jgi:hypothetical protein
MKRALALLLSASLGACSPAAPPSSPPLVDATKDGPGEPPDSEPRPPRFVQVAELDVTVALFAVEGAVLFASTFNQEPNVAVGIARPERASFDRGLTLEPVDATMLQVLAFAGSYPDDLHVVDVEAGGAVPILHHRVFRGGRWQVVDQKMARRLAGVVELAGGTLALAMHFFPESGEPPELWTISGSPPALVTSGPDACPEPNDHHGALVTHEAFGATRKGTIIAYGLLCGAEPAVEIWRAGEAVSRVVKLPSHDVADDHYASGVVAGLGDEAWAYGRGFWHYDGEIWRGAALPAGKSILRLAASPEGELWAIADGRVFRHDGAWRVAELPSGAEPESLVVTREGEVWIAAQDKLLRLLR